MKNLCDDSYFTMCNEKVIGDFMKKGCLHNILSVISRHNRLNLHVSAETKAVCLGFIRQSLGSMLLRLPAESPSLLPIYIAANPITTATDADRMING